MLRSFSHCRAGLIALVGLCFAVGCGLVETDAPATAVPTDEEEDVPEMVDKVPPDVVEDVPPDVVEDVPPDQECTDTGGEVPLALPFELPGLILAEGPEPTIYSTVDLTEEPLVSEVAVPLALGTEAPSAVRLKLGSVFDLECGTREGEFSIVSIEVLEGDARVTQTEEPSVVTVEVEDAGDSLVEVRSVLKMAGGGACSEEPVEVPLVYSLLIHAEEFEWSVELTEGCPPAISSGLPLPVKVRARDSAGQIVQPMNIAWPALSVSASGGLEFKAPRELTEFLASVVPVGAGTATVSLLDGSSSVDVRVHAPEELNGVYLGYWLSGIVARGDLPLDDGGSYEVIGEQPQLKVYARWVAHEGTWLCGKPDAGDFRITSLTPDVCPVESRICQPQDDTVLGSLLYESIPIIANGTCTIRIDAPGFAGGAGAGEQFSVSLENRDLAGD